jgi:hypothetical protein
MLPLEKTLFDVPRVDRDDCIVARHYGFDGRGGADFQRTGDEYGLTRERVRQIIADSDPLRQLRPSGASTVDRVIASIAARLPAPAADLEKNLQIAGLSTEPFRIEGIFNVAGLLGRSVPFRIDVWIGTRFVIPATWPRLRDFLTRARRHVRRHGMARIADFGSGSPAAADAQREAALISAILSGHSDFRWLDRRSGWFWLARTRRNRAVERVLKMLAVANPLAVSELRGGLGRMGSPLAPDRTLLAFCRQIDGLSVRGDVIYANPGIESAGVLNKTERDIFQLLSENDGCMSNLELLSQSCALGMKRPTFYQCVTHSPIVARYNGSHYRLIGSPGQNAHAQDRAALGGPPILSLRTSTSH